MRYITIPAIDKKVSIRNYIAGIRLAKANPEKTFKHGLTCWYACKGADIVKQFVDGIHDRINQAIPYIDRK